MFDCNKTKGPKQDNQNWQRLHMPEGGESYNGKKLSFKTDSRPSCSEKNEDVMLIA